MRERQLVGGGTAYRDYFTDNSHLNLEMQREGLSGGKKRTKTNRGINEQKRRVEWRQSDFRKLKRDLRTDGRG